MSHSTQEFRNVLRAARRAGTPLVAVRTNDPASAIAQVSASVADKKNTPILTWDILNGVAGRNDSGHTALAKLFGETSAVLGPADVLAAAQRSPKTRLFSSSIRSGYGSSRMSCKGSGTCETSSRQAARCLC